MSIFIHVPNIKNTGTIIINTRNIVYARSFTEEDVASTYIFLSDNHSIRTPITIEQLDELLKETND